MMLRQITHTMLKNQVQERRKHKPSSRIAMCAVEQIDQTNQPTLMSHDAQLVMRHVV